MIMGKSEVRKRSFRLGQKLAGDKESGGGRKKKKEKEELVHTRTRSDGPQGKN